MFHSKDKEFATLEEITSFGLHSRMILQFLNTILSHLLGDNTRSHPAVSPQPLSTTTTTTTTTRNSNTNKSDEFDFLMNYPLPQGAPLEECIPMKKILNNISSFQNDDEETGSKFSILITTGSFCPIHRMHVGILDLARKYVEETMGYKVLGGFISPSHDEYVSRKLRKDFVNANHRIEMCGVAVKDHAFIDVSSWEARRDGLVSAVTVTRAHLKFLFQHPKIIKFLGNDKDNDNINDNGKNKDKRELRVMYVCGADMMMRSYFSFDWNFQSVIIIGRGKYSKECENRMQEVYSKEKHSIHYVQYDEDIETSSTIARKILQSWDGKFDQQLTKYIDNNVICYITNHGLFTCKNHTEHHE